MAIYDQQEIQEYVFGSPLWAGIGDPVLSPDGVNQEVFWDSFLAAQGGKGFSRLDCEENRAILLRKYARSFAGQPIVRSQLSQLWYMLLISHNPDFVDPQGGEPEAVVVSPEQEFTEWMEGKSEYDVRQRRSMDKAFSAWFTASNRAQIQSDDVMADQNYRNNIRTERPNVNQDLREWAASYHKLPVSEVKRKLSPATNPAGHQEFNRNFQAAMSAGLV
jgi:hypothetical protein